MASGIRVTPEQLQQVATQLSAGAGNVDGILAQLTASVAPLGTDWAGMAQLMTQASAGYAQTEQGIAASFGLR